MADVGTIYVGHSDEEEELNQTFLTTGIFQRKEGDPLDGRRSFKGQRFKRQATTTTMEEVLSNNNPVHLFHLRVAPGKISEPGTVHNYKNKHH